MSKDYRHGRDKHKYDDEHEYHMVPYDKNKFRAGNKIPVRLVEVALQLNDYSSNNKELLNEIDDG